MKTPSVELTDTVLQQVMTNPNFQSQFPFLATAMARANASPKLGCGGCGRKKRRTRIVNFDLVRRQIAEMPAGNLAKFKRLLNTDKVLVRYRKPNGGEHKVKF